MERIQDRKSKADPGYGVENYLQENSNRLIAGRAEHERRWNPWVQEEKYVPADMAARIPRGDGLGSDPCPQIAREVGEE